jgi:hypothetical protein
VVVLWTRTVARISCCKADLGLRYVPLFYSSAKSSAAQRQLASDSAPRLSRQIATWGAGPVPGRCIEQMSDLCLAGQQVHQCMYRACHGEFGPRLPSTQGRVGSAHVTIISN